MLAAYVGAGAPVKPVNGKNPLVLSANNIYLQMPGEIEDEDDGDWDDDEDWEEDELDEPDSVGIGQREPLSEDEQFNGVNEPPPSGYEQPSKVKRRRRPPMPRVPEPDRAEAWHPPFEVLPDGTVTGPKLAANGAPPGSELPMAIAADGTEAPFDPPKGSMEMSSMIFRPR